MYGFIYATEQCWAYMIRHKIISAVTHSSQSAIIFLLMCMVYGYLICLRSGLRLSELKIHQKCFSNCCQNQTANIWVGLIPKGNLMVEK